MKRTYIKQIEQNSSGGVRISAFLQVLGADGQLDTSADKPEQAFVFVVGPDDDWDDRVAENDRAIHAMGFPSMDAEQVSTCKQSRDVWLAMPSVKEELTAWRAAQEQQRQAREKEEADRVAASARAKADEEERFNAAVEAAVARRRARS